MKSFWLQQNECTACAACMNICPVNAIQLVLKSDGEYYPQIDSNCIDCDQCEKICQKTFVKDDSKREPIATYGTYSLNDGTRFESTSGGLFSELARPILSQGGKAYGAAYDDNCIVRHRGVHNESGLAYIRRSKYVQSNVGLIYREIEKDLEENKRVLFCGTPCQIAGLTAYIGEIPDSLILIDFICRGVNSPKAFEEWLSEIEEKEGSKAVDVWFKYKEHGWKKSPRCTRISFENGNSITKYDNDNTFMIGYLDLNLFLRESCTDCRFKGFPRLSDITLADFWGVDPEKDDDGGCSLVLINSEKGKALFETIQSNLQVYEADFEKAVLGNPSSMRSVEGSIHTQAFMHSLNTLPFSEALEIYRKKGRMKREISRFVTRVNNKLIKLFGRNGK